MMCNGWNQTTRQGNVETGRIANKVSLNQWFTESEGYTNSTCS